MIPPEYAALLMAWAPHAARQRHIAHHPGNAFTAEDDTPRGAAGKRGTLPAVPRIELPGPLAAAMADMPVPDDAMYHDQIDELLLPHLSRKFDLPVGDPWRTTYTVTTPRPLADGSTRPALRRLLLRYHVPGVVVQGEVVATRLETWEHVVQPLVALYWPEGAEGYGVEANAQSPVQVRDPRNNAITWYTPVIWTVCTTDEEPPRAPSNARAETGLITAPGKVQRMMPQGGQGVGRG